MRCYAVSTFCESAFAFEDRTTVRNIFFVRADPPRPDGAVFFAEAVRLLAGFVTFLLTGEIFFVLFFFLVEVAILGKIK